MSAERSYHDASQELLESLQIFRRRFLRRDTVARVLGAAWLFPAIAILPAAVLGALTDLNPVKQALMVYPAVLVGTAIASWLRGISLEETARRVDATFGLRQRVATALEVAGGQRTERLGPMVAAEGAEDVRKALEVSEGPALSGKAVAATGLALVLLMSLSLVPSGWLSEVIRKRHDEALLRRAGEGLQAATERLHEAGPDLPRSEVTSIRLELGRLAEEAARQTLTPEQTREEVDRLLGRYKQMGPSPAKQATDKDIEKLEPAEAMKKVLSAIRRGDVEATRRETLNLAESFAGGGLSEGQLKELGEVLSKVSSDSSLPGMGEAADGLRSAIESGDANRFGKDLTELVRVLEAAVGRVRQEDALKQGVETELRNVAALLAGQPMGTSVSARAAEELMRGSAESTGAGSSSTNTSSSVGKVGASEELSRSIFEPGPIAFGPAETRTTSGAYQGYIRRYFQSEK